VVDAGESVFCSGGRSTRLAAGSLVSVPAGCVHACNPAPGSAWSYQMLHLDAAWVAQVLQRGGSGAGLPGQAHVLHSGVAYRAFCVLNATLYIPPRLPRTKPRRSRIFCCTAPGGRAPNPFPGQPSPTPPSRACWRRCTRTPVTPGRCLRWRSSPA